MKIQTKIALVLFLIFFLFISLFSGSVYYLINKYSFTDFYKRLEIRAVVTAKAYLDSKTDQIQAFKEVRNTHLERLPDEKEYIIKISPDSSLVNEAQKIDVPVSFLEEINEVGFASYQKGSTFYSGILYGNKQKHIVLVSAVNYYVSHHLSYLRNLFIIALIATAILAFTVSILFSRSVLNPVKNITNRVKDISSKNLHMRLDTPKVNDEMSELTTTFNNMLDRLETSFETQKNFISNASHELGTPLTTIIGEADVALARIRKPEEYIESLLTISNEAERLDKITRSLLFLARTGFTSQQQEFTKVRMDQLIYDVKETMDHINAENNIRINLDLIPEDYTKLKIHGNEQLLHLALTNIISNGCKYSDNNVVKVSIGASNNHVVIVVEDNGIGIPETEIPYIYDPFFRASNTKFYEGYGIGLPLARNIVRMHKGEIYVTSEAGKGVKVQLSFPQYSLMVS